MWPFPAKSQRASMVQCCRRRTDASGGVGVSGNKPSHFSHPYQPGQECRTAGERQAHESGVLPLYGVLRPAGVPGRPPGTVSRFRLASLGCTSPSRHSERKWMYASTESHPPRLRWLDEDGQQQHQDDDDARHDQEITHKYPPEKHEGCTMKGPDGWFQGDGAIALLRMPDVLIRLIRVNLPRPLTTDAGCTHPPHPRRPASGLALESAWRPAPTMVEFTSARVGYHRTGCGAGRGDVDCATELG